MNERKKYDSTVARIAGNIAGYLIPDYGLGDRKAPNKIASKAVAIARAIVAEVERTEPQLAATTDKG